MINEFSPIISKALGENIACNRVLSPDLHQITADKIQIEQVLLNLVVNARDAMPDGGTLTIETANVFLSNAYSEKYATIITPGDYIMLAITDTGHG